MSLPQLPPFHVKHRTWLDLHVDRRLATERKTLADNARSSVRSNRASVFHVKRQRMEVEVPHTRAGRGSRTCLTLGPRNGFGHRAGLACGVESAKRPPARPSTHGRAGAPDFSRFTWNIRATPCRRGAQNEGNAGGWVQTCLTPPLPE